jgi:uncharacterized membrane protein YhhN
MKLKHLTVLFLIVAMVDSWFIVTHFHLFRWITKPLLCIVLIIGLMLHAKPATVLAGFACCCAGDSFLLLEGETWFIAGLGFFLLAQLLFTISMLKIIGRRALKTWFLPKMAVVITPYFVGLLWFIWPQLNAGLKLPVLLYAIVIGCMLLTALCCIKLQKSMWILCGALFFVVSDSLLAIQKFGNISLALELPVMLTYIAAIYFLALGFLGSRFLAKF